VPPPEVTSRHARPPAWTIISKPPPQDPNADVPGPGYYNAAQGLDPGAAIRHAPTIGTAPRYDVAEHMEAAQKPGPCHYDPRPSYDAVLPAAPHISLSFRNAVPQDSDAVPGPNAYNPVALNDLRFPAPPHWSFGKALADQELAEAASKPGPNQYSLPELRDAHGVPFLTAPRFDGGGHSEDVPGPGTYTPLYGDEGARAAAATHHHPTFGTEQGRNAPINVAPHSPPPHYNVTYGAVDPAPIAYSIPRSAMSALYADAPQAPPAHYNTELPRAGPAYSFPRSEAHPGPVSASPGPIYTVPPPRPPPQWTFGRDPRFHDAPSTTPGPTDYNPPSAIRIVQPVDMARVTHHAGPPALSGAARGGAGGGGAAAGVAIKPRAVNSMRHSAQFVRAKVGAEDTHALAGSPARAVPSDHVGTGVSPPQQQTQPQRSPPSATAPPAQSA
jgi:hypothetical protein